MSTATAPSSAVGHQPDIQILAAAYKVLDLELRASPDAIQYAYRELTLLNQPDRWPNGSPERQRAADKLRQADAAYALIQDAPLHDHPLAIEAAAHEQERVRDEGVMIDRPVSVATEVIGRFVFGVVAGLVPAYALYRPGVPGGEILVWAVPLALGIVFMYSERPIFGRREDF
jgi:DnaJ domain